MMEFHISRSARDRYRFNQDLFSYNGNVIFANLYAVRRFTQSINQKRDLVNYPEKAASAGQINAMGLIDEIFHHMVSLYRKATNPLLLEMVFSWLEAKIGTSQLDTVLREFCTDFPPLAVYQGKLTVRDYYDADTEGIPNKYLVIEELIMLFLANKNPAANPYLDLFDAARLEKETAYNKVNQEIHAFFDTQSPWGPDHQNLIDMLRSPALVAPNSFVDQLEYIRQKWGSLLGKYLYRILTSLDVISEEQKLPFTGPGIVPIPVYDPSLINAEPELYSQDQDWMPSLVILAKNTYVWLDQLSRAYQQPVYRLDQIPDQELDKISHWGFSGLWLIGIWERSAASKRIKQLCGNQDAVASAYSLAGYEIAQDLGGYEAYRNLRDRAWQRGIRLASDMVPNHMGIDSNWVIEHPDWFISLDYSPFPGYTFNGPDLSHDDRVSLYIEDHYYDRSDAAVVFKRVDHTDGSTKYIYHGNDGTSMPWNDTAQLNYLNPKVREQIIQTILQVARQFPIIRFDAAMTLAKKHFQRLWYPVPGSGGAIPSRAEYGLSKYNFDQVMPKEIWREVVDRVAAEAPGVLLLAEAFWLMEGYFVRTLGMHRVYNSAFMNMLRDEDNAKYRQVMKNTMEFDIEILKRYVNFMNNPDERTAVDQYGKGDKYFGICIMMITLPGLPMFGHGQVEGYSEKYGMEFRRALWDEKPDHWLVERHEQQVFPIMRQRRIFAGVDSFLLFDFFTDKGYVNEDVYAYSNSHGDQYGVVLYHNRFADTRGWIRTSAAYAVKGEVQNTLIQKTIAEGLNLRNEGNIYCTFRDHITGLEYIRSNQEIQQRGLFFELHAYQTIVLMDFHEVTDDVSGIYRNLAQSLNGKGVPSIHEAFREMLLQPILNPFSRLFDSEYLRSLLSAQEELDVIQSSPSVISETEYRLSDLYQGIKSILQSDFDERTIITETVTYFKMAISTQTLTHGFSSRGSALFIKALDEVSEILGESEEDRLILLCWALIHPLGKCIASDNYQDHTISCIQEWHLMNRITDSFAALGYDQQAIDFMALTLRILITQPHSFVYSISTESLEGWLESLEVRSYIEVNRYQNILWFNKERFEKFTRWMYILAVFEVLATENVVDLQIQRVLQLYAWYKKVKDACEKSNYQLIRLLEKMKL